MDYDRIVNPETGRYVSLYGPTGQRVINNYLNFYQSGGANTPKSARCKFRKNATKTGKHSCVKTPSGRLNRLESAEEGCEIYTRKDGKRACRVSNNAKDVSGHDMHRLFTQPRNTGSRSRKGRNKTGSKASREANRKESLRMRSTVPASWPEDMGTSQNHSDRTAPPAAVPSTRPLRRRTADEVERDVLGEARHQELRQQYDRMVRASPTREQPYQLQRTDLTPQHQELLQRARDYDQMVRASPTRGGPPIRATFMSNPMGIRGGYEHDEHHHRRHNRKHNRRHRRHNY